ncbi:MAG: prenyltransferase [Alphaproteobacteria bacterium]|nr:prenyltransferase [Alphaproteobacteria bacterium]
MMKRILFWLNNSRLFSLPMTFMSWLVVFLYSLKAGGNFFNGILALIGIAFAHLATNLFDDYVDYKAEIAKPAKAQISGKSKCEYLKNGKATLSELLKVIMIYCSIAFVIGVYLTFSAGWGVILLALIGGIITLTYSKISAAGYSEIYVGLAFGPLLFEGVHYVMCRNFSAEVLWISLAVVMFTVGLVYMNNLLDYDNDVAENKNSICVWLRDKQKAALGLLYLYCAGYVFCLVLTLTTWNYLYYLPILILPYVYEVYKSAREYGLNKDFVPPIKRWYYPLDNWEQVKKSGHSSFYLRLFLARNLMIWFSTLMCVAVLFS